MDLDLQTEPPTVETFWRSRHFSVSDYTQKALVDVVDFRGDRPRKEPFGATEAMISEAEQRFGVRFPETLRALYRLRNCGGLPTYYVPLKDDPKPEFDDWTGAFANDYNDVRPLAELESLAEHYLEFKEEDDPPAETWLPGSERMIILTKRYEDATLLDCRGYTARVLVADIDFDDGVRVRAGFESFDAFFAALRVEKDELEPRSIRFAAARLDAGATPDQFWGWSGGADHGTDDASFAEVEARLGVALPDALKALYRARNGGRVPYRFAPSLAALPPDAAEATDEDGVETLRWLPPVEKLVSLRTLSDRLAFQATETPWAETWRAPEKLVVLTGSFEKALMLDYRDGGDEPRVVFARNLDQGEAGDGVQFVDLRGYLAALRAKAHGDFESATLTDARISARVASARNFWAAQNLSEPAWEALLSSTEKRLGLTLPTLLKEAYLRHDGGDVAFGYLPPQRPTPPGFSAGGFALPQDPTAEWLRIIDRLPPLIDLQTGATAQRGARWAWPEALDKPEHILLLSNALESSDRLVVLDYGRNPNNADHNHLLVLEPDPQRPGRLGVTLKAWRPFQHLRALRSELAR